VKIVVGLGNPGKQYEGTRHNVGWMVLDRLAERAGMSGRVKARDAAAVMRGRHGDQELLLVKPTTYMNLSGLAVRKVLARERAPLEDLLVVVDDFALPLGRLRLREEGSAGGHNGLRSIIGEMGTQRFARLRVGIGDPGRSAVDHVLSRFAPAEETDLDRVLSAAADAVEDWMRDGPARAANRWNAWQLAAPVDAAPGTGAVQGTGAAPGTLAAPATGARITRAGGKPSSTASGAAPDAGPRDPADGDAGGDGRDGGGQPPAPATAAGPDADGIVRTRTGWRKLLPGGVREHER
jgi:PTH1 family peptidyl-tRNA hydrolase